MITVITETLETATTMAEKMENPVETAEKTETGIEGTEITGTATTEMASEIPVTREKAGTRVGS